MASSKDKKVSIIIPAYNEAKVIGECIESLANQLNKNFEAIIIDDFSNDKTGDLAKKTAGRFNLDLKVVRLNKHQERGVARNLGAKHSKGEHLLFIDADMKLDKNVISDCVDLVNDEPEIKAIIIPELSFGNGFWAKCKSLEKKCYLGDDNIEAARFFNKHSFWKVGGWDEEMISGEDWDLTKRVRKRYSVGRIQAEIFHNEERLTIWSFAKKKFYYASKAGVYLKKYPPKFSDLVFFIFRPAYLRNWKLFLSDPLHGIGMLILKFIEIVAGGLGFLYSKLPNPR